ncbi:hypothetical protein TNCT_393791 [Trichonephila clavata]|uniref:39S ribosomal protein L33, mitochondrial n=1 Tax=Trichonephila clavata TaxID=2740835 RepID=A0A8X6M4H7_TRICU|nr:hypothetical protein TNCT_393791 [Trichonephila clavata]
MKIPFDLMQFLEPFTSPQDACYLTYLSLLSWQTLIFSFRKFNAKLNDLNFCVLEFLIFLDVEMGKFTHVIVTLKSVVTHHTIKAIRPKNSLRMEVIKFDPHAQRHVLYQEKKKTVNFIP